MPNPHSFLLPFFLLACTGLASLSHSLGQSPEPNPYVRPLTDSTLFSAATLTLDRDQRADIAKTLVRIAGEYGSRQGIHNQLRTHLIGLALNLNQGERSAITLSGQLALPGWSAPADEPDPGFIREAITHLNDWVSLIENASDPSPSDHTLAAYLSDLLTQIEDSIANPSEWIANFQLDWSAVVPPDAYPTPSPEPEEPAVADVPTEEPDQDSPGTRIDLKNAFQNTTASVPTIILYRANKPLLKRTEVDVKTRSSRPGLDLLEPEFITLSTNHQLDFSFASSSLSRAFGRLPSLRNYWHNQYTNPPAGFTIFITLQDYITSNGTSSALAVGVASEILLRNVTLDPNTAFVGSLDSDGNLLPHEHVNAILRGRLPNYPQTLIIPHGQEDDLIRYAEAGRIDALVKMQVLSAKTLPKAIELGNPDRPENVAKAMTLFADIQSLRMTPIQLISNPHVQNRLREILTLCPNHVSAQVLLRAGQRASQGKFDMDHSLALLKTQFEVLEELSELDASLITKDVTDLLIPAFRDQLRELRPLVHENAQRILIAFNDAADAIEEVSDGVSQRSEVIIRRRYLDMQERTRAAAERLNTPR